MYSTNAFHLYFQSIVIAVAVAIITILVILFFGIWKLRAKGNFYPSLIAEYLLRRSFFKTIRIIFFISL